jgi:hypothetical protein
MDIASQPLFYLALGFAGMFLCAWLFDLAYKRYMPGTDEETDPAKPSLPRALLYMVGTIGLAIVLWFVLYKTNLLIADLLLLAALASFAVGSYRIRLRPLLAHGLAVPHLAALVVALCLWAVPILWFMHLHLAGSYGAA